jgi:hypothetical protein
MDLLPNIAVEVFPYACVLYTLTASALRVNSQRYRKLEYTGTASIGRMIGGSELWRMGKETAAT